MSRLVMQSDLQSLYISTEELKEFSGIRDCDCQAYQELKYPLTARLLHLTTYIERILFLGWGLIPIVYLIKWSWLKKQQKKLLQEVEKFNAIVQAIAISDRLVAAGNPEGELGDRQQLIKSLKTTREHLICALKTERIFRENKRFIANNSELFTSNIANLDLPPSDKANQYSRLLKESLQVTLELHAEMRNLQNRDKT